MQKNKSAVSSKQQAVNIKWKSVCLTSAYLAPVEYYVALANAETVFFEKFDSYEKQTYRNRCNILTANGTIALTIPVEKPTGEKILTRDIRISGHNDWQLQHWRSIESAYNSSAFFEYYKDDFVPFYEKKWDFLWDFNLELQAKVLELLDLQLILNFTEEYQIILNEDVIDLRESIHPKKNNSFGTLKSYYQVFEQRFGFQPNLSIIDLLFNMGNESILILTT
ncbi:MAG: WbqC family protein [Paludibacter sp.]